MIKRTIKSIICAHLAKKRSLLLLGPRQTGKTTLLQSIQSDWFVSLIQPRVRLRYEQDPSLLSDEIEAMAQTCQSKPLVIIDEVQKVPMIMDVVQDLVDRNVAQFILTGSSARKLKHNRHINLLPGRIVPLYMSPLMLAELPSESIALNDLLLYGSLPQIYLTESIEDKNLLLEAYVTTYLEEEIRVEATVRNLAHFSRFMELAASESGGTVNYLKLSKEIGISHTTIAGYYQVCEDCLILTRIEPFVMGKTRRRLQRAQKYLFFDLGVRRVAAKEGEQLTPSDMGRLFEQFVGLALWRYCQITSTRSRLFYWRDTNGPEVDWVLQLGDSIIPIEVKLTDKPNQSAVKHLALFLEEYPQAKQGYVICQVPRKMKLCDNIYALPWHSALLSINDWV